jgi:Domain of unknown function DUF143.
MVILKLGNLTIIADYFVIISGDSMPQLKAISNSIMRKLKSKKLDYYIMKVNPKLDGFY